MKFDFDKVRQELASGDITDEQWVDLFELIRRRSGHAERVLGIREACNLATIISWAQRNAVLTWLLDGGDLNSGTARCIGDERGNFLASNEDVRDAHLRITTIGGFEWFPTIAEVLERVEHGTMVERRHD